MGEWLFVFPLCGFSLSLFCNYYPMACMFGAGGFVAGNSVVRGKAAVGFLLVVTRE